MVEGEGGAARCLVLSLLTLGWGGVLPCRLLLSPDHTPAAPGLTTWLVSITRHKQALRFCREEPRAAFWRWARKAEPQGEVRCCGWARVLLSPVRVLLILLFCGLKPPTFPSVGGPLITVIERVLVQSGPAKALAFPFRGKNYSHRISAPRGIAFRLCVFYPDTRRPAWRRCSWVAICGLFAGSVSSALGIHIFGG